MIRSMLFTTAAAVLVPLSPAAAQAVADPTTPPAAAEVDSGGSAAEAPVPGNAAKAHEKDDEAIVVTGSRRKTPDVLGGVKVLDTEEMAHDVKPSLGDTLQDLPGVSSTSFGPSSSRPILRGFCRKTDLDDCAVLDGHFRKRLEDAVLVLCGDGHLVQFMPHMPGVRHIPPGHIGASAAFGAPFACAANVENSCFRWFFPHDGHSSSATSVLRRTSFSNFVPQSSHLYS